MIKTTHYNYTWLKPRIVTKKTIKVEDGNGREKIITVKSWLKRKDRKRIK